MPTNPLQPRRKSNRDWVSRFVAEVMRHYDGLAEMKPVPYVFFDMANPLPDKSVRILRKIIVRAAKEESAHLVTGLCKTLHAANKATRDLEEEVGSACGKISPEVWAVNDSARDRLRGLVNKAALNAGRVSVLETQLLSARSADKIATARAESAEAECARLRMLLNARSELS